MIGINGIPFSAVLSGFVYETLMPAGRTIALWLEIGEEGRGVLERISKNGCSGYFYTFTDAVFDAYGGEGQRR